MRSTAGGLVVLLPARNCADDIPGWYESVSRFADAVVALDDGSTDETRAALAAHPLLQRLLTNPRRETYEGWDDAANRNLLLQAAADLNPAWILSLDADERIDPADAAALRGFVDRDAIPGLAYGFRVYRMIEDLATYDANANALWVYRLFGFEPGQEFPDQRLHFVPVPRTISRQRWVKTTLRIQHLGSLTAERRRARFEKYREADPACDFQPAYTHLLAAPSDAHPWETRPPDLPVLFEEVAGNGSRERMDLDDPVLSAVVIARNDEDRIERAVRAVVDQQVPDPFEVIVVTSGSDRTAEIVREKFPDVRLIELDHPALPGEARNVGLRGARGDYVSFPGSHVELAPGSLAARLRAHQQGWAMVTGQMLNGTRTAAGWAAYFLDHATGLPGAPAGELRIAPVRCSYMRHLVLGIGGFPEDMRAGEDTVVNTKLFALGHSAVRVPDVLATHHSPCRRVWTLVRHHFQRGRARGRILLERHRGRGRLLQRETRELAGYVPRRLRRIRHHVAAYGGDLRTTYHGVAPLVALGALAAWVGTWYELLRPGRGKIAVLLGTGHRRERRAPRRAPTLLRADGSELRTPPERRPVVFVHVPKTAGATLRRILEREYGGAAVFSVYEFDVEGRVAEFRSLPAEKRSRVCAVAGHMEVGFHRLLPGAGCVTLVREPVDRIVSYYHYVLRTPDREGHRDALDGITSLEEFVTSSRYARFFNNQHTRFLGGNLFDPAGRPTEDTLARALRNLAEQIEVVGLQARFDESVLLMRRAFGWGWPVYESVNVAPQRPAVADLDPGLSELIRAHNSLDVTLYEHAKELFEKALREYGPSLETDLATLARANERFRQGVTERGDPQSAVVA